MDELHKLCCKPSSSARGRPRRGNYLEDAREILREDPEALTREVFVHGVGGGACTPLHYAAWFGNTEIAKVLVDEFSADVNIQTTECGDTPLGSAVFRTHPEMTHFLLERNASPNLPRNDGETPLHMLVRMEDMSAEAEAIFSMLLSSGADVNALTCDMETPLHYVARYGNAQTLEALIISGATDPHTADLSPMDIVLDRDDLCSFEMVQLLVASGECRMDELPSIWQEDRPARMLDLQLMAWLRDIDVLISAQRPSSTYRPWGQLAIAVDGGHLALAQWLLVTGADQPTSADVPTLRDITKRVRGYNQHLLGEIAMDKCDCDAMYCTHLTSHYGVKHVSKDILSRIESAYWTVGSIVGPDFRDAVCTMLLCFNRKTRADVLVHRVILSFIPIGGWKTHFVRHDLWEPIMECERVSLLADTMSRFNLLGDPGSLEKPALTVDMVRNVLGQLFIGLMN